MLHYWAADVFRSWNKRIMAWFIVFSMLLSDTVAFTGANHAAAEAGTLICSLTEHQHTDACYEEVQITDGEAKNKDQFSVHHHSDGCYDESGKLICGMSEGKYYHSHSEKCCDESGKLVCGLKENELYAEPEIRTERKLACGLEEHIHGPECYSAPEKNEETAGEPPAEEEPAHTDEAAEAGRADDSSAADHQPAAETPADPPEAGVPSEEARPENEESEITAADHDTADNSAPNSDIPETAGSESGATDTTAAETDAADTDMNDPAASNDPVAEPKPSASEAAETVPESPEDENTGVDEISAFTADGDVLASYNGSEKTVTVPDGIRQIGKKAFFGNKAIVRVVLPDSVEVINSSAFAECSNLEQVVIGENSRLEVIGMAAFRNDKKLDTSFADRVKRVVGNAFDGIGEENTGEEGPTTANGAAEDGADEPAEENQAKEDPEPYTEGTADGEEPGEQEDQAEKEIPAETELTITSAEDAPYRVSVTFPAGAGIPEGTELAVTESSEPLTAESQKQPVQTAQKDTEPAEGEACASIPSLTAWDAGEETPEILLYRKTLNITLVDADGEPIEAKLAAAVSVSVTLPGIEEGQEIEVSHITGSGSELIESTNHAGTVTFTADSLYPFEFTSRAKELQTWTSGLLRNTFFGKTETRQTGYQAISVDDVTEGLDVLEAFSVTKSGDLWMTLRETRDPELGELESVSLYTVENGRLGAAVIENISATDVIRFNLNELSCFALVKDSGLRRQTQDLGDVTLDGMMPVEAMAEAQDVTEDYADIDFCDAGTQDETVGQEPERASGAPDQAGEATDAVLLAAYDISILNDGEEYQPEDDNPIAVEIFNDSFHADMNLQLWHISDDGTKEEITDFTVGDGKISFDASGFSVYVVTETILGKTITASDGNSYEINVEYNSTSGIPMQGTELVVSELTTTDPAYGEYLAKAADTLSATVDSIGLSRVFDIRIVDAEDHDRAYEPSGEVNVSIRLIGEELQSYPNVDVLHFVEDGAKSDLSVYDLDSTVNGETVQFSTDGFSVYVVIGHEDGIIANPRVEFHFITDKDPVPEPVEVNGVVEYYIGGRYPFKNKKPELQYTQILKDGEALELINDPGNQTEKYFYGWYIVDAHPVAGESDEYGIGTTDPTKLYYSWPAAPVSVTFESPINIQESNVSIGDTVHWSISGVSGSGTVDSDGNVHVLLAPVFEKYNFANFMLYPRDSGPQASKTLMTRKMIALGSSSVVEVKISDIQSASTDPIHLIFTGWEYFDDPEWIYKQTVSYTGAEMQDPGKDGVYLEVNLADTTSIDLYPRFVQARWVDFFSGVSGSGATYVASKFRESWGFDPQDPPEGMADNISDERNILTSLTVPTRAGYQFEGWYAFAVTDPQTGEILNLNDKQSVSISYLDSNYDAHTATDNMKAVKITNENGAIIYNGEKTVTVNGQEYYLFTGDGSTLKLFDGLDRLTLCAHWIPVDTEITIVYWIENAEDSNYTASATKTISTADLTGVLPETYTSGSIITLDTLKAYDDLIRDEYPDNMLVDHMILDDVGAVPKKEDPTALVAREEIFYDLNDELSTSNNLYQTYDDEGNATDHQGKVIDGQGTTSFNVYYSRKIFKLVFHIGRDGYVKNAGQQRADGNYWIEYMYKDDAVTALLGHAGKGQPSYEPTTPGELAWMKYGGRTYDSSYVTNSDNIRYDYIPGTSENDQNLYIITAKYGAYIENLWPSPVNSNFEFNTLTAHPVDNPNSNLPKSVYIWTANYASLYHVLSFNREIPSGGETNGSNADINGMYEYMSAELCANRTGNDIINENQVHHLVAYFGEANNANRFKEYHFLYEQVDGVALPEHHQLYEGSEFMTYLQTTWSGANTNGEGIGVILDKTYYEDTDKSPVPVISNLPPQYQLGTEIEGYRMVFSCYDEHMRPDNSTPPKQESHVYFFYTPREYKLTFKFETGEVGEYYLYKQSLAGAAREAPEKEGYYFDGWYTNEAGEGERFDFASETMPSDGIVLYPVYKVLQYSVKIDPNGGVIDHINYNYPDKYGNKANDFGVTGTGYNTTQATYFTANYGTTVGEYSIKREYIRLTEKELDANENIFVPEAERYYYINTQLDGVYDGDWGLPPNLRNAVYMTEAQLRCYYNFYKKVAADNLEYYTGVQIFQTFDAFAAHYTSYPGRPYRPLKPAEHYSFMGWYEVTDEGVASMPFNFNEPVKGDLKLRAQWRLDGGYYLQYNPIFIGEDENGDLVSVTGHIDQWTDPKEPGLQLYADQAPTHILRAPDKVREEWVFRGWRVVKKTGETTGMVDGTETTYDIWTPIQLDGNDNPVYYQPGDNFIVDSNYISETTTLGSVIHMQAYYELDNRSARRPERANLTLDADGGYITNDELTVLDHNINLDRLGDNGTVLLDAAADQIVFGDIQSNISVHLVQYAVHSQYQDRYDTTPKNYFRHQGAYFLLGFDEDHDDDHIAQYPADSVIAVQRTDNETLYAVWERMVYVNFINTTDEDIILDLTGTGNSTVSIVNVATGLFDREKTTSHIVVPARANGTDGRVKIVLPGATPDEDRFTATAINDHLRKKMSVSGEFPQGTPYENLNTTSNTDVKYGGSVIYEQTLRDDTNGNGIFVTFTEIPVEEVVYDVNGGTWTQQLSENGYEHQMGDIYALTKDAIDADPTHSYHPSDPVRDDMIFVGWTEYKDIAEHTDFHSKDAVTWGDTTIIPDEGSNVLKKIQDSFLWDFDNNPPPYDKTLYAVWSETATATFNITKQGSTNHVWTGPATTNEPGNHVFYRASASSNTVTYTLMKGEMLPRPSDPTNSNWLFLDWVTVASFINKTSGVGRTVVSQYLYDFDTPLNNDIILYTSWTEKSNYQVYTFTVNNIVEDPIHADEEFTYTISVKNEDVELHTGSNYVHPAVPLGSVETKLKNNEQYTVEIAILRETSNGTHNYTAYDVYVKVTDRGGTVIKEGHLLNYIKDDTIYNEGRQYTYKIGVEQTPKEGYSTNVFADETGEEILTIGDNGFSFLSSTGSHYNPNTNAFAGGTANNKTAAVTFVNRQKVELTLTKTVTTILGDADYDFTFTLDSVNGDRTGTKYAYVKTRNGSQTGTGEVTTADGENTFNLKHGESIVISLPRD